MMIRKVLGTLGPFQPQYGLTLDAAALTLAGLNAFAFHIPCQSDTCLLVLSRINDLIPFDRYYLSIIDHGGSLRDALLYNALMCSGFAIAIGLFLCRLTLELIKRETRVAGDDRVIWLLIAGFFLVGLLVLLHGVDFKKPMAKTILVFNQVSVIAAVCFERGLVQLLARLWD